MVRERECDGERSGGVARRGEGEWGQRRGDVGGR